MVALIISDIHLGSPLFNKKNEVIELLSSAEYNMIILNGDIFDIWENDLDSIICDNLQIVKAINDASILKPVYYLEGNHDDKEEKLKEKFPLVRFTKSLQIDDIFIIHGDEFDILISKYSWLAKLLFIPHWICQRICGVNIKAFFRELTNSISNKKDKKYYSELVYDIDQKAIDTYKDRCNYLIMGHTHFPKIIENSCTYINSGDIIYNNTYLKFDIKTKTFEIKKV